MTIAGPWEGPEPTPVGWAIARVVDKLPKWLARDLLDLLRRHLGPPPGGDLREIRLGLIIEVIGIAGEPAGTERYDEERESWRLRGELGPTAAASPTTTRAGSAPSPPP